MKVRFANINDIDQLIQLRFDYFAAAEYYKNI